MEFDLNTTTHDSMALSDRINRIISKAWASPQSRRGYLGASSIGEECLRRAQLDWLTPMPYDDKTSRIFNRGHWGESLVLETLIESGFLIRTGTSVVSFSQLGGLFRGHADGVIEWAPTDLGLATPAVWECKTINARNWKDLVKEGVAKKYPKYAKQIALYQAYLGLAENPAILTALNADTMDMAHLLVPFDPELAQKASDDAVRIIRSTEARELLPRVSDDPRFWLCRHCAHRSLCHGVGSERSHPDPFPPRAAA